MNKTARQHSAEMRNRPFRGRFEGWHKVRGYLVKTDEAGNVARGHIFAVEIRGGVPKVYSYTRRGAVHSRAGQKLFNKHIAEHACGF